MKIPLTLKETQKGLIKKEFTAVELVDAYLDRITKHDKEINSLITITKEVAYEKAKRIDKLTRTFGERALQDNPLLGAVVVHKDLFLTKGVRTTAGSKVLEFYIPAYSATVVRRMSAGGAIMLGKANCDAWAHGASGENSDFGPTKNPWNKNFVPGGSSSGSAAALAANFALISTGTDTGGSIRQPANFCGVVGLKPTYGAVSRYGIVAMASSLDCPGPMARTVDDVEKVFEVIRGEDGLDSTVKDSEFKVKNSNLRIGIPKEYFVDGVDEEVKKASLEVAEVYRSLGVEVAEVSLPHTKYAISVYYIVQPAEVSSNLGRYDGIRYGKDRSFFGDEAKRRIMLGTYVLSAGYYEAYYLKAQKLRSRIIKDFDKAFEKVDAILAPVSPTPPFRLGEKAKDPLKMYLADVFTVSANIAGLPGLAVPSGFTKEGLPLGFQLMGPRFSERTLFNLGKLFQKEMDWKPSLPF